MWSAVVALAVVLPANDLVVPPADAEPAVAAFPLAGESGRGTWTITGEYVAWWLRRGYAPPVLTTGPAASQGILGQPGVRPIYGDERLETRHGDRFFGGRVAVEWLDPSGSVGVEGRAFFLERDSTYFTLRYRTDPLVALSYFDASTGREASEIVAGADPQRGLKAGGFVGYSRIELFGEEANLLVPLLRTDDWRVELLAGGRFLQMRDRYHHTATSRFGPDQSILTGVVDNIRVHNAYYGGQVGLRGEYQLDRWFVQMRGTIGVGADVQLVRTFGERLYQTPQQRLVTHAGLFVQPSNSGSFSRTVFDGVGEVGVNVGYRFTDHWRALLGYTLLCWADPLRAASQVDRVVDRSQQSARPAIPFSGEAFWAQGVHVGLEWSW